MTEPNAFLETLPESARNHPAFEEITDMDGLAQRVIDLNERATNPLSGLPDDLKTQANLGDFKTVEDLAKSYVEQGKLIGNKKISKPGPDATDEEWAQYYTELGRPEKADEYEVPAVEGVELDDERVGRWKDVFHKLGLSKEHARGVLESYLTDVKEDLSQWQQEVLRRTGEVMQGFREEWQGNFDHLWGLAETALKHYLGPEGAKRIMDAPGEGENPALIKAFAKIGELSAEDNLRGGRGDGVMHTSQSRAVVELQNLYNDKAFMKKYLNNNEPGHLEAVEQVSALAAVAYPGKHAPE